MVSLLGIMEIGCTAQSTYPIPEQHRPFEPAGLLNEDFVSGGDVYASHYFIKDIWKDGGPWRWTGMDPTLRFRLKSVASRRLLYELVIHESTFPSTGPVTIIFYVNEHALARETINRMGDFTLDRAVPSQWLSTDADTIVRAHIENPFRSSDGTVMGFLLKRAGFVTE